MKRIWNKIVISIFVFILYIAFTGFATELTIISGLVLSITVAIATEAKLIERELNINDIARLLYLFKYLLRFIVIELKEHIEIAKIVFSRKVKLEPKVVKIPIDLRSSYGIAFLASTITNTPGTIVIHIDSNRGNLYIHWLTPKSEDLSEVKKIIVGDLENIIKKIFE
ncbi:MAG: Na+/H+ antiporter subunit E [Ignisphaera sp.]